MMQQDASLFAFLFSGVLLYEAQLRVLLKSLNTIECCDGLRAASIETPWCRETPVNVWSLRYLHSCSPSYYSNAAITRPVCPGAVKTKTKNARMCEMSFFFWWGMCWHFLNVDICWCFSSNGANGDIFRMWTYAGFFFLMKQNYIFLSSKLMTFWEYGHILVLFFLWSRILTFFRKCRNAGVFFFWWSKIMFFFHRAK